SKYHGLSTNFGAKTLQRSVDHCRVVIITMLLFLKLLLLLSVAGFAAAFEDRSCIHQFNSISETASRGFRDGTMWRQFQRSAWKRMFHACNTTQMNEMRPELSRILRESTDIKYRGDTSAADGTTPAKVRRKAARLKHKFEVT